MRTYYIYDLYTDKKLGEVKAISISAAELKAASLFLGHEIYALTTDENEPLA